jgi:hypothetical protein
MIGKVDNNQFQGFLEKSSSRPPNSAANLPDNNTDVSVQVNYTYFIDRAMQAPKTDTQAVRRARKLLLSGRLESPDKIEQAAENIVTYGI